MLESLKIIKRQELAGLRETSVTTYKTTRCHSSEKKIYNTHTSLSLINCLLGISPVSEY